LLPMASFQKTFRKSGSHHAEFHSLQGVEVKIGEKFRPPKKVKALTRPYIPLFFRCIYIPSFHVNCEQSVAFMKLA